MKIRVTKLFDFEAAHALTFHNGACRNLHGHSYKLSVCIIGEPNLDKEKSDKGMVIDFGCLKKIVKENIVDIYDHKLILHRDYAKVNLDTELNNFNNLILKDREPTCENMVVEFAEILKKELPNNVQLFSVKLHETANSFAEWYAGDNVEMKK